MRQKHIFFKKKIKTMTKKEGFLKTIANMLYVHNITIGGVQHE
jgi:hypothetical protein